MLQIGVISTLPEIFDALNFGITGRAIRAELIKIHKLNLYDWGLGRHRQIDDKPYGGGPGMVMMYEPLKNAILAAKNKMPFCKTVYLSPQGKIINQNDLNNIVEAKQDLLFLAGRFEGIDQRIIDTEVDEQWSVGDFVLSGGEFAALVFIDALIRLLPGSLGNPASAQYDSFMDGIYDYPHYTRPEVIGDQKVPQVLLSGDHKKIALWRRKEALGRTLALRPDLMQELQLSELDQQLLLEFKNEEIVNE